MDTLPSEVTTNRKKIWGGDALPREIYSALSPEEQKALRGNRGSGSELYGPAGFSEVLLGLGLAILIPLAQAFYRFLQHRVTSHRNEISGTI